MLRPKKPKTGLNKSFRTADFETWDGLRGTQFRMGAYTSGNRVFIFHSLDDFMASVLKSSNIYYFHNLSFDGRFIIDWLISHETEYEDLEIKPIYSAGIIAILVNLSVEGKKRKITFIDSLGLLRSGQANLEKNFLGKVEKHYIDWSITPSDEELIIRVRKDVLGMHKVLSIFFKELNQLYKINPIGMLTLGSICTEVLQTRFIDKPIYNPFIIPQAEGQKVVNWSLDAIIREGYYGGRTEVLGNIVNGSFDYKQYNEIDANSFYPSQYHKPAPNGSYVVLTYVDKIPSNEGFFVGELYEKYSSIPVLPTRYTGKTVFGFGQKIGVWGLPLIRYANDLGLIEIKRGYFLITKDSTPILEKFGKEIYQNRLQHQEEGNHVSVYIDKLLLNNAYGKFGQHLKFDSFTIKHKDNFDIDDPSYFDKTIVESGNIVLISEKQISTRPYQMVDKASYITSYCLVEIHKELSKAKFPTYCDTDSVHGIFELENHNIGNDLGQWKPEYNDILDTEYILPKVYWIKYRDGEGNLRTMCKAKGYNRKVFEGSEEGLQRYIELKEFKEIVKNGFEFELYMGLKMAIRNKGKILDWHVRKRKQIQLISDKRIYFSDGTSEPLEIIPPIGEYERLTQLLKKAEAEIEQSRPIEKGSIVEVTKL